MLFSRRVKSSHHCLPSPDGSLIATLFATTIQVREVRTLEVVNTIKLPRNFSGPVSSFQWSPSSRLLLVALAEQIEVFSGLDESFHATVRNGLPPATKPAFVGFGASDSEVLVFSSLGLKLMIYSLASTKAVEIANPKFWTPLTARNGFCLRPRTGHLAMLTRTAGKDMISVHDPVTRLVRRSWLPDTNDAHGLVWSPDGKWLVAWESAAHGHKLLFYTPDGHLFKEWSGAADLARADRDHALTTGIKMLRFSADTSYLAVINESKCTSVIDMKSISGCLRLQHPSSLEPDDSLQIWQEQNTVSQTGISMHTFIRARQAISPPAHLPKDKGEVRAGCLTPGFDPSSVLLATHVADCPSTVWIWDARAAELRAVLLFHANVTDLSWHPSLRETLMVRCEGDRYRDLAFVWDPLSEGPRTVVPPEKPAGHDTTNGTSRFEWLNLDEEQDPALFWSDSRDCLLVSLADSASRTTLSWQGQKGAEFSGVLTDESPLELMPVESTPPVSENVEDEDASELDDTFHYKREVAS